MFHMVICMVILQNIMYDGSQLAPTDFGEFDEIVVFGNLKHIQVLMALMDFI